MEATNSQNLPNRSGENKGKIIGHATQMQTIFQYLEKNIATASMVTDATGVPQKCITRYKRDLEKNGLLIEVKKDFCKFTGFKAWYISTDKAKFPQQAQLNLFTQQ